MWCPHVNLVLYFKIEYSHFHVVFRLPQNRNMSRPPRQRYIPMLNDVWRNSAYHNALSRLLSGLRSRHQTGPPTAAATEAHSLGVGKTGARKEGEGEGEGAALRVLDIGTGPGWLAITAAQLGATEAGGMLLLLCVCAFF